MCQYILPGSYKHRINFWVFKALSPGVTASTLDIILVQLHWLRKKMKFLITAVVLKQRLNKSGLAREQSYSVKRILFKDNWEL